MEEEGEEGEVFGGFRPGMQGEHRVGAEKHVDAKKEPHRIFLDYYLTVLISRKQLNLR